MEKIKETPILFTGEMVRAVLDGRKTQTRRVWKMPTGCVWDKGGYDGGCLYPENLGDYFIMQVDEIHCPYGREDNYLWVRESFCYNDDDGYSNEYSYMADHPGDPKGLGWKPSIHMPRAASRITLQITNIRVERLQDISRGDAMAEGCPFPNMAGGENPVDWYAALWDSLGKDPKKCWSANPWVWVIEFRRIEP